MRQDSSEAVVTVIAFLLGIVLVISFLGIQQANWIPNENSEAEFNHQEVSTSQMKTLRSKIVLGMQNPRPSSTPIDLAVDYPDRAILRNPPELAGTVRSKKEVEVSLDNAKALDEEARDFFDGSQKTYRSKPIEYSPRYNYFQNAGDVIIENTEVFNEVDGNTVLLTRDQFMIQGRDITLPIVRSNISLSHSNTQMTEVNPESSTEFLLIEPEGGSITLEFETNFTESDWREVLSDQMVGEDGYIKEMTYTENSGYNEVKLTLVDAIYNLRVLKIHLSAK